MTKHLVLIFFAVGCIATDPTSSDVERISPNGPSIVSATEKCSAFGYGVDDELASCVLALRADFCGDGVSFTITGTLIDIHDNVGIVSDTADWALEAEWSATGARCISSREATRFWQVAHARPSCTLEVTPFCGSGAAGALITKLPRLDGVNTGPGHDSGK